ncbi:hypothetical protein AYI69_g5281 [Smittium culicis]|uniref:Uncharacterized protein n=2 Tax=Smittium culicis TaxID=133412 RepID=A0A1R1Y7F2_9FUNG|nr:hypothetical protein AYI69_g8809 [Smittium culicis]OMJ22744.1 hypothetical protein AYI69_g5281 [Smittium culicis]
MSLYPTDKKLDDVDETGGSVYKRNLANSKLVEIREKIRTAMSTSKLPLDSRNVSADERNEIKKRVNAILGIENIGGGKSAGVSVGNDESNADLLGRVDDDGTPAANSNSIENDEFFDL